MQGGLWLVLRRWPSFALGAAVTALHLLLHGLLSVLASPSPEMRGPSFAVGTLELWWPLGLWVCGLLFERVRRTGPRFGPRPDAIIALVVLTLGLPVLGELLDLVLQPLAFGCFFFVGLVVVPSFTLAQLVVISIGDAALLLALTWLERTGPGWPLAAARAGLALTLLTGLVRGSLTVLALGALSGWGSGSLGELGSAAFFGLLLGQWEHLVLAALWAALWLRSIAPAPTGTAAR